MWTVPADDPRYAGDQHPAGPVERAIDKAVETVTGRCRWICGDVECPGKCRMQGDHAERDQFGDPVKPDPPSEVEGRSAAWWRDNEPAYDGSHDGFLTWLHKDKPASDADKRHFAYRDAGYTGWLDDNAYPVDDAEQDRLNASFGRSEPDQPGRDAGRGIDMPPPAEPYQPPTKPSTPRPAAAPTTTTSSSGATMTSADTYSGLRARIIGVASRAPERQGPLQQALQGVEEDIAELNSISEDSSQPGIQEALGSLMRAKESIEEANWMVGAAQASTEGAAAGLQ